MLHTKFQGHQISGSREFYRVFAIYGHDTYVASGTQVL